MPTEKYIPQSRPLPTTNPIDINEIGINLDNTADDKGINSGLASSAPQAFLHKSGKAKLKGTDNAKVTISDKLRLKIDAQSTGFGC